MENDQNTDNNEVVEEVTSTTEESQENEVIESEESEELTPEQKKGIAKRRLTKLLKEFPDLIEGEDEDEKQEETKPAPKSESLTREEAILVARGMDDDGLDLVNRIAARDGISVTDAASSTEFDLWKKAREQEDAKRKAQLSATGGGSAGKKKKDFNTPGLTDEEFAELYNKRFGL